MSEICSKSKIKTIAEFEQVQRHRPGISNASFEKKWQSTSQVLKLACRRTE